MLKAILVVVILFLGLFLITAMRSNNTYTPTAEQPKATKDDEIKAMRAAAGLATIMRGVRNPESFVLESAEMMPDGSDCFIYRTQNGFGGMTREYAVLTPKDQIRIATMHGDGYTATYNRYCAKKSGKALPTSQLMQLAKFVASRTSQ